MLAPMSQPTAQPPGWSTAPGAERIVELDSLRGLAALAVALYHYTRRYDELYGHEPGLLASLPWGNYGVQVFFIISGFVILMSVQRSKSAATFAVQRAARLYPPFWVACLVTWLAVYFLGLEGRAVSVESAALNLTMAPFWFKWLHPGVWYIDGAYWSLKEELLFYIVIAGVLAAGLRRHALAVVTGLMVLHLAATLLANFTSVNIAAWVAAELGYKNAFNLSMVFTLRWFSLFALGMVIYEARSGFRRRHAAVLLLVFLDQLPGEFWTPEGRTEPWREFVAVCLGGFLVWVATHYRPRVLRVRPLLFLGTISYSFYLLHQNIGYIVIRELEERGVNASVAVLGALAVTVGLASGLAFGVEKPTYRIVKGWLSRRQPVAAGERGLLPST
jgi:peptidoglycan/LPS O-acetylase OafA/YrhL